MLKKLKARELGLPDPEPIEPPSWLNPPKKEKKRKVCFFCYRGFIKENTPKNRYSSFFTLVIFFLLLLT